LWSSPARASTLPGRAARMAMVLTMVDILLLLSAASLVARGKRSKLHHCPADNFSRSQQLEIFVELVELEDFEGVANLVLSGKRHDLAQVGVVAPERAVKGLFARNPWEQRDVDAVANQPHIDIVAANREQAEGQLHHLGSTRAVDD